MALADLPNDALRAILQRLGPQELCRCKSVCRKLASMACEVNLPHLDRPCSNAAVYASSTDLCDV